MGEGQTIYEFIKTYKVLYGNEIFRSNEEIKDKIIKSHDKASQSLQNFESSINNCRKCKISSTRSNFIFGAGDPDADLLIVGESPSKEDDQNGTLLSGNGGKLLGKILAAIGRDKINGVYILNILKCWIPNNRDPLSSEINKCEPYLIKQMNLIQPKLIVALGKTVGKILLKQEIDFEVMRNGTHYYHDTILRVTYHPSALLNNPDLKNSAWNDFKWIRDYLNGKMD
tara:strand:+ start:603 stop:1283 length:681 start_codon:yes stop_codon:yes gene_type:complete